MEDRNGETMVEHPTLNGPAPPEPIIKQTMGETNSGGGQTGEEAGGATEQASGSPVDGKDEDSRLRALATNIRDQDDLERDVGRQVHLSAIIASIVWLIKL